MSTEARVFLVAVYLLGYALAEWFFAAVRQEEEFIRDVYDERRQAEQVITEAIGIVREAEGQ